MNVLPVCAMLAASGFEFGGDTHYNLGDSSRNGRTIKVGVCGIIRLISVLDSE